MSKQVSSTLAGKDVQRYHTYKVQQKGLSALCQAHKIKALHNINQKEFKMSLSQAANKSSNSVQHSVPAPNMANHQEERR